MSRNTLFPVCLHDDVLDALSRLFDLFPDGLPWPSRQHDREPQAEVAYDPFAHGRMDMPRHSRPNTNDWSDPSSWAYAGDSRRRPEVSGTTTTRSKISSPLFSMPTRTHDCAR